MGDCRLQSNYCFGRRCQKSEVSHLILREICLLDADNEFQAVYFLLLEGNIPIRAHRSEFIRLFLSVSDQKSEVVQRSYQVERNIHLFLQFVLEKDFFLVLLDTVAEGKAVVQVNVFIIFINDGDDELA
jgi:hypothetical protein